MQKNRGEEGRAGEKREKRKSIEKYKILKIPLAEITDKSLTFSNRAQSRISSRVVLIYIIR